MSVAELSKSEMRVPELLVRRRDGRRPYKRPLANLWILLLIVFVASLALRLAAWKYWGTGAIESEGAEYARLAQNLRNGVGYVGLVTPGAQLNFNPLFPLFIAGISAVTSDYELAGRIVALIMGALLPIPVFGIGRRLFSRRVAFIAAGLVMIHPLLLHLSFTVFSEGPYITLLLTAAYCVTRALDEPSVGNWLLVGGAFGLAWLVRAEATAALCIALMFALLVTPRPWGARLRRALAALAIFLAIIAPQVLYVYKNSGQFRLEVKSQMFQYTGKRILVAERHPGVDYVSPGGHHEVPSPEFNVESGQSWQEKWAFYGIDSNLNGMGFSLRPHSEIVRSTQVSMKDVFSVIAKGFRWNAPALFRTLSADWVGAPFLPALALLGVVRRPWRKRAGKTKMFILLLSCAPLTATFFALWSEQRYYFIFIPFLCIWAAKGLVEIGVWLSESLQATAWPGLARPARFLVPATIATIMLVGAVQPVAKLYVFADSAPPTRSDKLIGMWIAEQQSGSFKIMDLSIPLAFHAGSQFTYFPYAAGEQTLAYADRAGVDYIILRPEQSFTKYYQDWLLHGIPDARAERLLPPDIPGGKDLIVYRWHRR